MLRFFSQYQPSFLERSNLEVIADVILPSWAELKVAMSCKLKYHGLLAVQNATVPLVESKSGPNLY
jgi:hypothetical protein